MERVYLDEGVAVQKRSRTWTADIYRRGRRVYMSLGTTDKTEAMLKGWSIVKAIQERRFEIEGDAGILDCASRGIDFFRISEPMDEAFNEMALEEKASKALDRLKRRAIEGVDVEGVVRQTMTQVLVAQKPAIIEKPLDDMISEHVTVLKGTQNIGKDWEKNVTTQLKLFFGWAKVKTFAEVERSHLEGYIAHVRTVEGRGDWCVRQKFFILAKFFKWAVSRRYLSASPADGMAIRKPGKEKVEFFLSSECRALIKNAADDERAAVMGLAIYASLRREEIFKLDRPDINLKDRIIELDKTKTDYPRTIPILDQLLPLLKRLPLKPGRIFTAWGDEDAMGEEITAFCKRITKRTGRWIGLQMMRRSFCTYLLANGASADTEAAWSGHGVKTAEGYYRGRRPLGESSLLMTYRGLPLEKHGVTERLTRRK